MVSKMYHFKGEMLQCALQHIEERQDCKSVKVV